MLTAWYIFYQHAAFCCALIYCLHAQTALMPGAALSIQSQFPLAVRCNTRLLVTWTFKGAVFFFFFSESRSMPAGVEEVDMAVVTDLAGVAVVVVVVVVAMAAAAVAVVEGMAVAAALTTAEEVVSAAATAVAAVVATGVTVVVAVVVAEPHLAVTGGEA